jgi:IS5 family transposase
VALDGGFASKQNLKKAKEKKIKDVCFSRKRGLEVEDMCRSEWVYKRLRRFRAGIEAEISWLKRCSEIADLWMDTSFIQSMYNRSTATV